MVALVNWTLIEDRTIENVGGQLFRGLTYKKKAFLIGYRKQKSVANTKMHEKIKLSLIKKVWGGG